MADIARSRTVPGANDNLSGVAVLLELADALGRQPPRRVRVILLSTGSEESFLEAMERFAVRHFHALPRECTTFLCVESVGSPQLMLLSGEGLLSLRRYPDRLIDELTTIAAQAGVPLRDPFRYRLATDGQVPLKAGYETAVVSSMDWYKAPSNYHWPSDRAEHLDRRTAGAAATLVKAFLRRLDDYLSARNAATPAVAAAAPAPANTNPRRLASSY
jgi:putative aminopeptidase FrvX